MSKKQDAIVPAYLTEALAVEQTTGNSDVFLDPQKGFSTPKIRRVEVVQRNSQKWAGAFGKIVISSDDTTVAAEETDHIDFLLVDSLVFNTLTAPEWMKQHKEIAPMLGQGIGARTMWSFAEDGRRVTDAQRPVCSSPNGVVAWPSNVGQDLFDYRTKKYNKIGFDLDEAAGVQKPREFSCIGCPFSQWVTTEDGKKLAPMCRETHSYIIFDLDRKELLSIKALNMGTQLALAGHRGQSGRRFDNEPLPGIQYWFSYTKTEDNIPRFRNRPEGRPTLDNPFAPVLAVRMTVTLNNFNPATAIPQFTLLDGSVDKIPVLNPKARPPSVDGGVTLDAAQRGVDIDEYTAYLKASSGTYTQENWRDSFMAMGLITAGAVHPPLMELPPATNPHQGTTEDFDAPFS